MITKEQFTKVIEDTLKLNKEYDRWDEFTSKYMKAFI